MRYVFANDLHINSGLSLCSNDPTQNPERILQYVKNNNFKTICITEHYRDEDIPSGETGFYKPQNTEYIKQALSLPLAKCIEFFTEDDKFYIGK